ncbi:hypothetical protein GGS21DRAFT_164585 [Xylaria nigripes]|nr:hypothetical protein GGS21DRAFT_164585 [Xylaria nigripes]
MLWFDNVKSTDDLILFALCFLLLLYIIFFFFTYYILLLFSFFLFSFLYIYYLFLSFYILYYIILYISRYITEQEHGIATVYIVMDFIDATIPPRAVSPADTRPLESGLWPSPTRPTKIRRHLGTLSEVQAGLGGRPTRTEARIRQSGRESGTPRRNRSTGAHHQASNNCCLKAYFCSAWFGPTCGAVACPSSPSGLERGVASSRVNCYRHFTITSPSWKPGSRPIRSASRCPTCGAVFIL